MVVLIFSPKPLQILFQTVHNLKIYTLINFVASLLSYVGFACENYNFPYQRDQQTKKEKNCKIRWLITEISVVCHIYVNLSANMNGVNSKYNVNYLDFFCVQQILIGIYTMSTSYFLVMLRDIIIVQENVNEILDFNTTKSYNIYKRGQCYSSYIYL